MGLHLIPYNLNINFVGTRKVFYTLSSLLIVVCVGALLVGGGPKYGIDFSGGTIAQVKFAKSVDAETLKESLADIGEQGLVIQRFGEEGGQSFLIRISSTETTGTQLREKLVGALGANMPDNPVDIQRLESVGPKVGANLRSQAVEAMYFATLIIAIYISGRFEQRWFMAAFMAAGLGAVMYLLGPGLSWLGFTPVPKGVLVLVATVTMVFLCWRLKLVYALGAVISILHDVSITVGIFALMGKEFDLTIIAALLTIVGYSLNDTIIVYDRIRENLQARKVEGRLSEIINRSINQTLSRTVLTSLTTLVVVTSLLVFGGGIIHDFALVMFIGIIVGVYSSIFVASPVLLVFGDTVVAQAQAVQAEREQAAKRERNRARAVT